ncbi:MAG: hypothetical protein LW884_04085 [Bacteroidetes bacterium]|jgi:hypothetical protein|nr:hypothetical protein [Bacteroidota bacterium]
MRYGLFVWLALLCACDAINPEEPAPAFARLEAPLLVEDGDTFQNVVPDVWLFQGNDYYGTFVPPTRLPFVRVEEAGRNKLFAQAGVWRNFDSQSHAAYPFMRFDTLRQQLSLGQSVSFQPVFRYFPDTLIEYAYDENFERQDQALQPFNPTRLDTANLRRTTLGPFRGAACGVVHFDADRTYFDVVSTGTLDLPRGTSPVWAEVKFRGNIRFAFALVAEGFGITDGEMPLLLMTDGYTDDGQWRAAYFDLTNYLSIGFPGARFRARLFAISDGSDRSLYLDDIRILHFQ